MGNLFRLLHLLSDSVAVPAGQLVGMVFMNVRRHRHFVSKCTLPDLGGMTASIISRSSAKVTKGRADHRSSEVGSGSGPTGAGDDERSDDLPLSPPGGEFGLSVTSFWV